MNIREHFATQLESAKPITLEQIEEIRASRQKQLTPEQYDQNIKAARLDTDELVGKTMLFYMLRTSTPTPQEGVRSINLKLLRVFDDELDQLDQQLTNKIRFVEMKDAIPVFEVIE